MIIVTLHNDSILNLSSNYHVSYPQKTHRILTIIIRIFNYEQINCDRDLNTLLYNYGTFYKIT